MVRQALQGTWACVWANDIDPAKARVYTANFGGGHLVVGDVAAIDPDTLPQAVMAWASFPCQDLSLAGWRRGMSAARSGTFWAFWRLMRSLHGGGRRPPVIVVENVVGLLHGDDFGGLCRAFAALDMRFGAVVLDARWFLPQSRPRVFVVAVDRGVGTEALEDASPQGPHAPRALVAAWSRLGESVRRSWVWWRFERPWTRVARVEGLLDAEPEGVDWHAAQVSERLLAMMTEVNRAKVDGALAAGGRRIGFLYKRTREGVQRAEVRFDGIAGCLRTPGGGRVGRRSWWPRPEGSAPGCFRRGRLRGSWGCRIGSNCRAVATRRIERWATAWQCLL
jgi:DNA (cytosine-5)-methyltransferase 1